jgi:hypothetical protein
VGNIRYGVDLPFTKLKLQACLDGWIDGCTVRMYGLASECTDVLRGCTDE